MPGEGGDTVAKMATEKGWEVLGKEIYPTGTTDFSVGLLKAREAKCTGHPHLDGYAGEFHPPQAVVRYENTRPSLWNDHFCC